jgi:hypothetical protein
MATKYLSINRVVDKTEWSDGLKKSMILDFVASGYGNVASLIGGNETETSKAIQAKVSGFSSGKNTYLQANQIAKIIHSLSSGEAPKRFYRRSAKTASTNDGEMIKDCSGWSITKKNLEDGRVVYNANIKSDTPKNKGDWAAIKGDVYVETTFKWNVKFQKFERWGQIENQDEVIEKLCQVLAKYYEGGEKPVPAPEAPTPDASLPEVGDKFIVKTEKSGIVYEITKMDMGTVFIKPRGRDFEVPYTFSDAKNSFANGLWIKIKDEEEETPAPKEDKSIPANPKLEYCRINWAEGFSEYTGLFPRDFSSFTEMTKFIAENIKEVPDRGYDKHGVEWKWKFDKDVDTDRFDVSQSEANPLKYPNLYASEKLRELCYYAWAIDTDAMYENSDEFYAVTLGKEGLELDDEQFNKMLDGYLTYYKQDKKRYEYNTPEERLERFKEVYPKLYSLFNSPAQKKSKADIEKAIKGLQFLADKGNDKAKKAIIGLKILLNK